MSFPILLQGWVTIRGSTTGTVVTQQESCYADLTGFKDVVAFTEVSDISGGVALNFHTAPTKDDGFLAAGETRISPATGLNTTILRYETAGRPPTRYLRWRLGNAGSPWSITFRIWLACNMSGNFRRMMHARHHQMHQQKQAQLAMMREALAPLEGSAKKPGGCGCASGAGGGCRG